jgi:hypothetical protein
VSLSALGYRLLIVLLCAVGCTANSTESWLAKRAALIDSVYGYGPGILSNKSVPDLVETYADVPGMQGLVWNLSTHFEITSTVFYSPVTPGKKSKTGDNSMPDHDCPR